MQWILFLRAMIVFESAVGHMAQRNRWWFGKEFELCVSTPHNSSLAS